MVYYNRVRLDSWQKTVDGVGNLFILWQLFSIALKLLNCTVQQRRTGNQKIYFGEA